MPRRPMFLALALLTAAPALAADERQLVELPPPMQQHMLSNMRDHLRSLEEMTAALAAGKPKDAAAIAENRIGMSSLTMHGADHLGRYMPEPMQRMGAELHHASSRFAIAVEDAELDPDAKRPQRVYAALGDIMAACNECHAAYRLR